MRVHNALLKHHSEDLNNITLQENGEKINFEGDHELDERETTFHGQDHQIIIETLVDSGEDDGTDNRVDDDIHGSEVGNGRGLGALFEEGAERNSQQY